MSERDKGSDRPRVLVLGASGLNGGAIVAQLGEMGGVEVVRGARDPRTVASWKDEGKAAVLIDLDDPLTFPTALRSRPTAVRACEGISRSMPVVLGNEYASANRSLFSERTGDHHG